MAYGMAGIPGNQRQIGVPKDLGKFPVVGNGLGGLPVRVLQLGDAHWIGVLGGAGDERAYAIAVTNTGDMYVCGSSGASSVIQLAKYNTSGFIQWQRGLSGGSTKQGNGAAVDASGNVYISGYADTVGSADIRIAKYDPSGVIQWQRSLGVNGTEFADAIATDSNGNVYICGSQESYGAPVIQIAKYNTSGTIQWQRRLGDSVPNEYGYGIAVDSSGNVYICGYSDVSGGPNIQIAKYNTSGTIQWQRSLGGLQTDVGRAIAVDGSANVYVCGYSLDSGFALQIAKYNTSGAIQWQRRLGGSANETGYAIAVDAESNIYVCGTSQSSGADAVQIAKYDSAGVILWQRQLDASASGRQETGYGIGVDNRGSIYIVATSGSTQDEMLFAKLPADGSKTGEYVVGGYVVTYQASALTESASSLTSSSSALTDSTTSLTDAASSLTDAATSFQSYVKRI